MHRAEIKLNSLPDADWAGSKNKNLLFIFCRVRLIFRIGASVNRIIVRCCRRELSCAGVYHFICRADFVSLAKSADLRLSSAAEISNHIIREFQALRLQKKFSCQGLCFQRLFHLNKHSNFIYKPSVDFCNTVNILFGNIPPDSLGYFPDAAVIHHRQLLNQFILIQTGKVVGHQTVHMLFQGTDRFHKSALKIAADAHDFSGCLHLGGQSSLGRNKFIERQTGNFYHAVIQHRFKVCVGFSCNCIWNLIQGIAQSDLGRHLCNGISCRFAGKSRRTADTGIHLDNAVLEAVRVEGILHVAASGDAQLRNNIQGGGSKHLILFIAKGLGRRYHDRVSCMNSNRVDIFHIADSNTVSCTVAHYFILNFFPACNAALHKHFSHTGKTETVFQDLSQLVFIIGDSSAASAKCISRAQNHRIPYGIGKGKSVLHCGYYLGSRYRLPDFFHGIFKFLTVLRFADRLRRSPDQTDMMFLQKTFFLQLHGKVQPRLASQSREHAVWFFLQYQLFHNLYRQRLNINSVCDILICHDGSRIGVQKHYLNAFLLQGTAGLCTGIVEFRGLSDNNRAGTDHKNFLNLFISRHCCFLPSFP